MGDHSVENFSKKIFVPGTIVANHGNLYARDVVCLSSCPPDAIIQEGVKDGIWEINKDTGSMFNTYYASGDVVSIGIDFGDIFAFYNMYKKAEEEYSNDIRFIEGYMAQMSVPISFQNYFYQSIFISIFSALERFLYCFLVRECCNDYTAFSKMIVADRFIKTIKSGNIRRAIKGPDIIEREKAFREQTQWIVYHRFDEIKSLYEEAFDIEVDFEAIKPLLSIRDDIVHRFGRDKKDNMNIISKSDVESLINITNDIVTAITHG